jgi:hypothetical protein
MKIEEKYLTEGTNWKNDPFKARDELAERAYKISKKIENIYISESQFFYDKNKKHIDDVGKKLMALEKAIASMEKMSF